MPRKRRKPSFTSESIHEMKQINVEDVGLLSLSMCNETKKRRSSMQNLKNCSQPADHNKEESMLSAGICIRNLTYYKFYR